MKYLTAWLNYELKENFFPSNHFLQGLRDGTRSCKLASILIGNKSLLSGVNQTKAAMEKNMVQRINVQNLSLAFYGIEEYAKLHSNISFK